MMTRYYNTDIRRFISQDIVLGSIGSSLSTNQFIYTANNPVNFFDPKGLKGELICIEGDQADNSPLRSRFWGDINEDKYKSVTLNSFSFILGLTPAGNLLDAYSVITGKNLITGEDENSLAILGGLVLSKVSEQIGKNETELITSGLVEGMGNLVENGTNVYKKFDLSSAYVKPKHLSTSGGNGAKFLGNSKDAAEEILRDAMKNGNIVDVLDNGLTRQGNQSYEIIVNAGKDVGTKGEQFIKMILSDDGGMLSAYPINK